MNSERVWSLIGCSSDGRLLQVSIRCSDPLCDQTHLESVNLVCGFFSENSLLETGWSLLDFGLWAIREVGSAHCIMFVLVSTASRS